MPLALGHALRHLLRAPGFTVLAAGTLASVALVAGLLPALRAARTPPAIALRNE